MHLFYAEADRQEALSNVQGWFSDKELEDRITTARSCGNDYDYRGHSYFRGADSLVLGDFLRAADLI